MNDHIKAEMNGDFMNEKEKYNFVLLDYKPISKPDIYIYYTTGVYMSQKLIKRCDLQGANLIWCEDKAKHVLALKKDEKDGMKITRRGTYACPAYLTRKYAGRYNVEEQDGMFILHPIQQEMENKEEETTSEDEDNGMNLSM